MARLAMERATLTTAFGHTKPARCCHVCSIVALACSVCPVMWRKTRVEVVTDLVVMPRPSSGDNNRVAPYNVTPRKKIKREFLRGRENSREGIRPAPATHRLPTGQWPSTFRPRSPLPT